MESEFAKVCECCGVLTKHTASKGCLSCDSKLQMEEEFNEEDLELLMLLLDSGNLKDYPKGFITKDAGDNN